MEIANAKNLRDEGEGRVSEKSKESHSIGSNRESGVQPVKESKAQSDSV